MTKKLHLIYVPGLGDSKVVSQRVAVSIWRYWGVEAELYQMKWDDKEPWEAKFTRLLTRIDTLVANNKSIGLVGASAGASAVINAYAARKEDIVGCVLIAGKINRPEKIDHRYHVEGPAFVTSVRGCTEALKHLNQTDRRRILSRYALFDELVQQADSRIEGAYNRRVPTIGHAFTIAFQLTLGAYGFISFLKRISR